MKPNKEGLACTWQGIRIKRGSTVSPASGQVTGESLPLRPVVRGLPSQKILIYHGLPHHWPQQPKAKSGLGHLTWSFAQMGVLKWSMNHGLLLDTVDRPGTGLRGHFQRSGKQHTGTSTYRRGLVRCPFPFPFYIPLIVFWFPRTRIETKEKVCLWTWKGRRSL